MNDQISRREWVALMTAAGAASSAATRVEADEAGQPAASEDLCPYFDQPLFCKGKQYCR